MLSHLVGAANRADIQRLATLETERAELALKVEKQQAQLREAIVTRDVTIRRLNMEERKELLAGLVGRADTVFFPVDCISHEAAAGLKRLCRQAAKPYLPLRSASLTSFIAALPRLEQTGLHVHQ